MTSAQPSQNRLSGYHKLASLMGHHTDGLRIFRRFGRLNMLSLLSLQAELNDLESEFDDICQDDLDEGLQFHKGFSALSASKGTLNSFQYDKLVQIRDKLEVYSMHHSHSL